MPSYLPLVLLLYLEQSGVEDQDQDQDEQGISGIKLMKIAQHSTSYHRFKSHQHENSMCSALFR